MMMVLASYDKSALLFEFARNVFPFKTSEITHCKRNFCLEKHLIYVYFASIFTKTINSSFQINTKAKQEVRHCYIFV